MALLNPIYRYTLITPFLIFIAIPTFVIAIITSVLALLILIFRTLSLGIDFTLTVVPYYVSRPRSKSTAIHPLPLPRKFSFSNKTNRRRRTSSLSPKCTTPSSALSLNYGQDALRDYEGVGGWQLSHASDEQDILWESINSRIKLTSDHERPHKESMTSIMSPEIR